MKTRSIGTIVAISAALTLGIVGGPIALATAATPTDNSHRAGKTVKVTVNEDGFSPSTVTVKKGEHLMLEFTRVTDKTCAKKVVFPELKISKDLPLDSAVTVHIPTAKAGTLAFQCGMGMYKSSVVVQ